MSKPLPFGNFCTEAMHKLGLITNFAKNGPPHVSQAELERLHAEGKTPTQAAKSLARKPNLFEEEK